MYPYQRTPYHRNRVSSAEAEVHKRSRSDTPTPTSTVKYNINSTKSTVHSQHFIVLYTEHITMTKKNAVGVKSKKVVNTEDSDDGKLNLQQEEFCKLFALGDKEVFGNGTLCYLQVYGAEHLIKYKKPMNYMVAGAAASRLLKKVKIINRINTLLEEGGFNDQNVDKQHLFLINQYGDLKSKLGAIKEYNVLKKRISSGIKLELAVSEEEREMAQNALALFLNGKKG